MKTYLFTATDKSGKRDTDGRKAASVEHLRMVLEREGYRDIEFIDDETSAQLREQWSEELRPKTQQQFRFQAQLKKGHNRGLLLAAAIRNNAPVLLICLGLVAYGLYVGRLRWILSGSVGALVLLGLLWRNLGTSNNYDELLKAYARGELDQAEALIRKLRASPQIQAKQNILVDLTFRQACVLARRGRLDEALALAAPLKGDPQLLKGMYESRTASIYYAAGRIPDFVRLMEQSWEASGHAQMQTLDLAFVMSRFGDVARARQLLKQVEERNLQALHAGVYKAVQGACQLRERDYVQASTYLREAVDKLKPFAASAPTWPFQGIIAGYAAIALGKNGERDAARALLAPWKEVALTCIDPLAKKMIQAEVL